MKIMTTSVFGVPGGFYEGEFPGTICFVPAALISAGQLDQPRYVLDGWASLNIKAQPLDRRLGSHLFPDLTKPVADPQRCAETKHELERLRPRAVAA
jgi:hypothetical protein